jgi:hypothetical protein
LIVSPRAGKSAITSATTAGRNTSQLRKTTGFEKSGMAIDGPIRFAYSQAAGTCLKVRREPAEVFLNFEF